VITNASAVPIQGVKLTFSTRNLGADGKWNYTQVATTTTGANGRYSVQVPARSYTIGFEASGFQTVYYNGPGALTSSRDAAAQLPPMGGATETVDASLTLRAASITGTVTRASDAANVSGVKVTAFTRVLDASNRFVYTHFFFDDTATNEIYT